MPSIKPIRDIANTTTTPSGDEWILIDNGIDMSKAKIDDAVAPKATEIVEGKIAALNLGTAATANVEDFATAAQGSRADTAVQPSDLATVATTGDYADLTNKPALGTVASHDVEEFATAEQGEKADSAVQPEDLAAVATTGSYNDLLDKPTLGTAAAADASDFATATQGAKADTAVQAVNGKTGTSITLTAADVGAAPDAIATALAGGTNGQVLIKASSADYDFVWVNVPGGGDMLSPVYDPTGVAADAFNMDNMREGSTNLILTAAERADIAANASARHTHSNKSILDATEQAFTTTLKSKLDSIQEGAQVNAVDSVAGLTGTITDAALFAALGLGNAATRNVGTTAGTVAAGNDYRFYPASATIKHFRVNPNLIYDVIEVKNNRLNTVRKEFAPGVSPDGTVIKIPARLFAKQTGAKIAINADGWRNADGSGGWDKPLARPVGLQIANGILYQDWAPSEPFPQAIVMMDDGFLVEANASDGISGAQWVANGAQWSIGWGAVCVRNGVAVDLSSSHMDQIRSARTILGQRANGEIVIVLIEGISNNYGALPNECGPLMVSLGCQIAFICDGGGSSQCWWKNTYALPSSDKSADGLPVERGVPTFIVIDPETHIEDYDSGVIPLETVSSITGMSGKHPLTVRHIGTRIRVTIALHMDPEITPGVNHWITNNGGFPTRYIQDQDGPSRIWISGNGGRPAGAFVSAPFNRISMEQHTDRSFTYISGSGSWPAPFTNLADE